jgi:hypothetical protein
VTARNYIPAAVATLTTGTEWPAPEPLADELPPVKPFPFACLPDTLRPWLEDIAERMHCPPDFPAAAAMVAAGSLIGRKVAIRPKERDDWTEYANLWGMAIGRPGLMKSPALSQALAPLERLAAEALEQHEGKRAKFESDTMLQAQRRKLAESQIKAKLRDGDEAGARELAAVLRESEETEPALRRFKTSDSTVEKLGELLAENPNGLLVFRDELTGWLKELDREGREGSRSFYLEAWNGNGAFTFDRVSRGRTHVAGLCVSIMGGIQPGPLQAYIRQTVGNGTGNDGLLQRFQVAVWPDIAKGSWRDVDRWPDTKAKNEAFAVFRHLDELTAASVHAESADDGTAFLRLAPDARERFVSWRGKLETRIRAGEEHEAFEAHLTKYRKLVPALALIVHLAGRNTGPVTLSAIERALLAADYLESHARRIYSAAIRPDTAAARELAKHLHKGDLPAGFTARDIHRKGWTGLATKEEAEAAIAGLLESDWLRELPDEPGPGRKTKRHAINPRIQEAP